MTFHIEDFESLGAHFKLQHQRNYNELWKTRDATLDSVTDGQSE